MVLSGFEYLGTVAFAISGAMVGIRKEMDVFGIAVLAVTTAVGGGILRDVLVGHTPPTAFLDPTFTLLALASAILTCVAHSWLVRITNVVQLCDAVGLGAFTAVGASLAITYELNTLYIMVFLTISIHGPHIGRCGAKKVRPILTIFWCGPFSNASHC